MKTVFKISYLFLLLFIGSATYGQQKFQLIEGIPHLITVDDPATIDAPEIGMLIYDATTNQPLIYTGSFWESWCTTDIKTESIAKFFVVKNDFPYLPVLNQPLINGIAQGTIYYSITNQSTMIYNGVEWVKLSELSNSSFPQHAGFQSGTGVETFKIPVLEVNPNAPGILKGAFYINSSSMTFRYFDGTHWQNLNCYPAIETLVVTDITGSSALGGGNIVSNGGSSILKTGIIWSTHPLPDTTMGTKTSRFPTPPGTGEFKDTLYDLMPNTTYYVRAYAINNTGITYGDPLQFTTVIDTPSVITSPIDNITPVLAESGGFISNDGGSPVTQRGIIWSIAGDPLEDPNRLISNDGDGVGGYSSTLSNLWGNTTYYVRAYAENLKGVGYGQLVEFMTAPPVAPELISNEVRIYDVTSTNAMGDASLLNHGGAPILEKGLAWSTDQVTWIYGTSTTGNLENMGVFTALLTPLSPGTTYYARGYAINSVDTAYTHITSFITPDLATITTNVPSEVTGFTAVSGGEITNIGNSRVLRKGIVWSTDSINLDISTSIIELLPDTQKTILAESGDGLGLFTSNLTGLKPGTTYYLRAYAINGVGVAYGNLDSLTTLDLAKVTTLAPSSFFQNTAQGGGDITSDGRTEVTQRGVVWARHALPTLSDFHTIDGNGVGLFNSTLIGLTKDVTYFARAYAINSAGIAYGEVREFKIIPGAPTIITLPIRDIKSSSAISGGDITSAGDQNSPITKRGIRWSLAGDPIDDPNAFVTIDDTQDGDGVGSFPSTLYGLLADTTYYVRAYAENKYGMAYGNLLQFTTLPSVPPILNSADIQITDITNTSAIGHGSVIDNGGAPVLARGIALSRDRINYIYIESNTINPSNLGSFIVDLDSLTPATLYYAKAYAVNSVGIGYSSETSFNTTALAKLTTTKASDITGVTAWSGGHITYNGDGDIIERGLVWNTDKESLTIDLETKIQQSVNAPGLGSFSLRMTELSPGTWYYYRAYAENFYGIAYGNIDSLFTATTASIVTTDPSLITNSTVRSGGTILEDGGEPISSRGVVWGISDNLSLADEYTINGSGKGTFTSDILELLGSTTYYVRAYARNSVGVAYGDAKSFTTNPAGIPIVRTTSAINIGGTTAVGRGNVLSHGGSPVSERGIVWNTTGKPMVGVDENVRAGEGSGAFSGTLTGLTPITKYYFRAYAINEVDTAYGEELVFTTFTTATVITSDVSAITATTATGGGDILSDGGPEVIQSGIVWSYIHPEPIYSRYGNRSDTWQTTGGSGIGNFIHQMEGLLGNTTYYVRAYAENSAGVSYGEVKVFTTSSPVLATLTTNAGTSRPDGLSGNSGGRIISNGGSLIEQVGVVWSTTSGFNPATEFNNRYVTNGNDNFSVVVPSLEAGKTYYVRALVITSVGTSYGNEMPLTTFSYPELSTHSIDPTSITSISADGGGEITHDGGTPIINSGLVWNTDRNPTLENGNTRNGAGKGAFVNTINELLGNTTYYVRAYATNSVGTTYGNEVSFTTQAPVLASLITHSPTIVSATAARGGGNIVSNGGALVTTRGLIWLSEAVWSNESDFIIDNIPEANRTAETGYFKGNYTHLIDKLEGDTKYYIRAYVVNSVGISYGQVVDFRTPKLPELTTSAATDISSSMAIAGGEVTDEGGSPVTSRGVIYSIHPNFEPDTVTFLKTANGGGEGIYESPLTRLKASTTYYVRAYARNIAGVSYGNQISFTTAPAKLPVLTTRDVFSINGTIATGGGNVTDDGGDNIISKGLVWSTQPGFDYKNVPAANKTVHMGASIGPFTSGMMNLSPGTNYYVRAYATNGEAGTGYGDEVSFTTLIVPRLTTLPTTLLIGGTNTKSGGVILSDGGNPLRNQGVIWSTINDPDVITTSLNTRTTNDVLIGDTFNSTITKLLPVTTYFVRAYATNNQGAGYGDILSFTTPAIAPKLTTNIITPTSMSSVTTGGTISSDGGASITKKGVIWSTDINFNPDTVTTNRTDNGTGPGIFSSNINNLELTTTYYVRAYATNSTGTGYGNQVAVTIFPTSPILETSPITQIGGYTAVSGGKIISEGGTPIIQKGIVWSTGPNPTIRDNRTWNGSGNEDFIGRMSNLQPNTKYYVRAYATNMIGTAYGVEEEFLTNGLPVLTVTKAASDIVATTASSGGEVTDDGRTPILARGITWSIYGNPTVSLSTKTVEKIDAPNDGLGEFSAKLTGMKPETTYYVRSYATNSVGTEYGAQISFKTLEVRLPTVTTLTPIDVDSAKATSGGEVTDDGGMPVTVRGFTWSKNPMPTTSEVTKTNHATGGIGVYTNIMGGLAPGTTYYVRAYAINSVGTAYGQEESLKTDAIRPSVSQVILSDLSMTTATGSATVVHDGGAEVIDRGLTWNTTGIPPVFPTHSDSTLSNGQAGTGVDGTVINGILKNLSPNTKYYVWAYATNREGTRYSSISATFTTPTLATVVTTKPTSITRNSARSGGNVVHDGGVQVTARGIVWSKDSTLISTDLDTKTLDGLNRGSFVSLVTGLEEGTVYYVRAYAINAMGISYGNLDSLKTLSVPKIITASAKDITSNSLTSGGEIPDDGGVPVLSRGVVWSSNDVPVISMTTKTVSGRGSGEFSSPVINLNHFTVYYIRAYATNSLGTAYGNIDTVRTLPIGPTVSNVIVENITDTKVEGTAEVLDNGGADINARGFVWNTTGAPLLGDNLLEEGTGLGAFSSQIDNIKEGPTYYVRAYAINSVDTAYSPTTSRFKKCPAEFHAIHVAGLNGAPENKTVTYRSVSSDYSGELMCWITQNLGAEKQATSATDQSEAAAGWYWQFNRPQGYKHDGTTRTPSNAWTAWIGGTTGINENVNWAAANDPCNLLLGGGWRMPTYTELSKVDDAPQNWVKGEDAYASVLKLHMAGALSYTNGSIQNRGTAGYYWSSVYNNGYLGYYLSLGSGSSTISNTYKTQAMSVRCLRDTAVVSLPTLSNVIVLSEQMTEDSATGTAVLVSNGGEEVSAKGLVWSTKNDPTLADHVIPDGVEIGSIRGVLEGLMQGPTYYVRAFATNSKGTAYSSLTTAFKVCNPHTVIHTEGLNGAPESKMITYGTVSSNISGSPKCWITQNLGAEKHAVSATDGTQAATGWYWQFNRAQGYKHDGTTRTPSNAWTNWIGGTTGINENIHWSAANDPCVNLLGSGWRLPTNAEWNAADAPPQNWTSAANAYSSELKLHMAGVLNYNDGTLIGRGTSGYYWSSNYNNGYLGYYLALGSGSSAMSNTYKTYGMSVRCLRDMIIVTLPSVTNVSVPASEMTSNSALGLATVALDGGARVTARGLVWNTTGMPTLTDNVIPGGVGVGEIQETFEGLSESPTYYVRAFATNSQGTAYSPLVTSFKICNDFTVIHTEGLQGAPVSKKVTYGTISSNISGAARCWITQNLGADRQASSATDNSESAAGWYWQFNRAQGYKHDGTDYSPKNAWTSWIGGTTAINENLHWSAANDPCVNLLGSGWRLPTNTEWTAADAPPQNWTNAANAYSSVLKLHMAGVLNYTNGALSNRGTNGYYWSSNYNNGYLGFYLALGSGSSAMTNTYKTYGMSVRCIRDAVTLSLPSVTNVSVPTSTMTADAATGSATIALDGGAKVTARGLVWNTSGTPTLDNANVISIGSDVGDISAVMEGLIESPTYYVRAFATNSQGTAYSPLVTSFKICNDFTVIHTEGLQGAPVSKTVTYGTISSNISGAARCWITQNLGADRQASSATDNSESAAGWYWQFNRAQGYKHDGTDYSPKNAWTSWIGGTTAINENLHWSAANDPCVNLLGSGWRLPTNTEWTAADAPPQNWTNAANAYSSVLKLHMAGVLNYTNGALSNRGTNGYYWSSNFNNGYLGFYLALGSGSSAMTNTYKTYGMSVRCIRDVIQLSTPTVSEISIPTSTMTASSATGTATVTIDGGSEVLERGLVWNTTGNPTLAHTKITNGLDTGKFSITIKDLVEGPTYYVRAFATNKQGTTYSPVVTSFKICNDFTVTHTAGINGAPVTKTVTYGNISSTISGAAKCWITQNLGADRQASSVSDASEEAAGWYWQFNRLRGYDYGTSRIPNTTWVSGTTGINENLNWSAANDPCVNLLGSGWRLPTNSEWTAADAQPQYWTSAAHAYSSVLKLHLAGQLAYNSGVLANRGTHGFYWSSNYYNHYLGYYLGLASGSSTMNNTYKTSGFSVRCLQDNK